MSFGKAEDETGTPHSKKNKKKTKKTRLGNGGGPLQIGRFLRRGMDSIKILAIGET